MGKTTRQQQHNTTNVFETMVEHLGEPLWLLDADSQATYANRAARQVQTQQPDILTWARTDTTLLIPDESGAKHFWRGESDFLPDGRCVLRLVEISREALLKEELRLLNERYTMLTEHAADVLWTMELDGRFSYVSPTGKDLRGYNVDELMAQPISETIVPEDYDTVMGVLAERLKIEAQGIHEPFTERFDVRQYAREGGLVWTEVIVSPLRDEKQELVAILGVTRNIDARKRVEEALRESEQRYRMLVENMADVVLGLDLSLKPYFVSPSAERIFGYTVEETMELGPQGILTPESLQLIQETTGSFLNQGEDSQRPAVRAQVTVRHKNGTQIPCEGYGRFLRDNDDQPYGVIVLVQDITERKAMEAALSASEKRFRAIIESSQDILYRQYVSDGRLEYVSPSMFTILGYTPDELINMSPEEQRILFHSDENPVFNLYKKNEILHGADSPNFFEREARMLTRSGELRWVHGTYRLTLDEQGRPDFLVGTLKDITKRKTVEEELAKRERDLRAILDTTSDVACLIDLSTGHILEVNEQMLSSMGIAREDLASWNIFAMVDDEVWDSRVKAVRQIMQNKAACHFTDNRLGRDFENNYYPIFDEKGEVTRLVIFGRDISEQKAAAEELAKRERDLRAILDTTTDIAFLVDLPKRRVVEANEKLLEHIGLSHDELMQLDFYDFMNKQGWQRRSRGVQKAIQSKAMYHGLDTLGGRHYEHHLYPIADDRGSVTRLVIFTRDITEQYTAQQDLIHYQQRLRALASQLTLAEERQRREFAVWLHDGIAQSLSALLLRLKLLRADRRAPFDEASEQHFSEILQDLEHAISSTRSLIFDLSPPLLYEVGFKAAIGRLFEKLQSDINCDGGFRVTPTSLELPHDRKVLLFQISRELLNNVRKHSKASRVEGSLDFKDGQIFFCLNDNGVGFEFQTIAQAGFEHGGFGLFSIEERLRDIDGKLSIISQPGKGTQVVVTVPTPTL